MNGPVRTARIIHCFVCDLTCSQKQPAGRPYGPRPIWPAALYLHVFQNARITYIYVEECLLVGHCSILCSVSHSIIAACFTQSVYTHEAGPSASPAVRRQSSTNHAAGQQKVEALQKETAVAGAGPAEHLMYRCSKSARDVTNSIMPLHVCT